MREYKDFCDEIKRRKEKIKQKKKQKKRIITTCISMAVCLSTVAVFPWDIFSQPDVKITDEKEKGDGNGEYDVSTEYDGVNGETAANTVTSPAGFETFDVTVGGSFAETDDRMEEVGTNPSYGGNEECDGTNAENVTARDEEIETFPAFDSDVLGDETREEVGTGGSESDICGFVIIQDAAGNDLRYADVLNSHAFVEFLVSSGVELMYGKLPADPDETKGEYVTTGAETKDTVEETLGATGWDSYEEDSYTEPETGEAVDDETETEIECDTEALGDETAETDDVFDAPDFNVGDTSAREKLVFIEIVYSDYEKWVFACDREEYETLYYKLEELFAAYEVK